MKNTNNAFQQSIGCFENKNQVKTGYEISKGAGLRSEVGGYCSLKYESG